MLAGILFSLGLTGLLVRRNLIFVLMSLEVMLNAAGLAFVVAGSRWNQADGQVMFLFILAVAAYADAFNSGESSLQDRDVVRADYTAQRNIGLVWSQRADSGQRQEGLARLATACRISEQTQLGVTEACDDLRTILGPREKWPAPLADPLIDTLSLPKTERRS